MISWLKGLFESKSVDIGDYHPISVDSLIFNAFSGNVSINSTVAFDLYRKSSALSTAVNLIATKIEDLKPVMRDSDGNLDHQGQLLDFLKTPNGFQTWRNFVGSAARHYMVTGNAYFHALGNTRSVPIDLYAAHPGQIGPFESGLDDFPDQYQLRRRQESNLFKLDSSRRREGFGFRYYHGNLQELFPVRGFSSRINNVSGDSPLEPILLEIKQHIQGRRHNNALLENGARPSSVWYIKDRVGRDAYEEAKKVIRDDYTGAQNSGKAILINGGDIDFKELIVTNRDMDFVNLDRVAKEAVFMAYGIPIPLITADRQTFNNYEKAVQALFDDAVFPVANAIFEALSRMLLPRLGIDSNIMSLSFDSSSIPALRMRKFMELKTQAEIGVQTINELRAQFPELDDIEGGDAIFASASSTAIVGDDMPEEEPFDPDLIANNPSNAPDDNNVSD